MNKVRDQIFNPKPDIKAYDKVSNQELAVNSIDIDTNGVIVFLHTEDNSTYVSDDVDIYKNFLHVPGVGNLKPGTLVRLDNDSTRYTLLFGWHTNVSNQTVYSWFLRPLIEYSVKDDSNYMSHYSKDLSKDRTVYKDMINHIWEITP